MSYRWARKMEDKERRSSKNHLIRTSFFGRGLYGIRPIVSSQNQSHDVVGANTWLKRWAEGRKGEDAMTVHQELDLAGRVGNGGNLGRAPTTNPSPFLKNQPV